jgi:hypothetical protein
MIPIKAYLWMPVFIEVLVLLVPFRRFMASPAASFPANSDFFFLGFSVHRHQYFTPSHNHMKHGISCIFMEMPVMIIMNQEGSIYLQCDGNPTFNS